MSEPPHSPPSSRRLHFGCGTAAREGWFNQDGRAAPGVDLVCDLTRGLPLASACFEAAVGIHVLQDLAWGDIPPVLAELRRVLVPGGVLRLGLPDLDRAIDAYRRGDAGYFHVPDADARALGTKLVTQVIWYGSVRTPFTYDAADEWLRDAGFRDVQPCAFGTSALGQPWLAQLDNRERESFFVEARA